MSESVEVGGLPQSVERRDFMKKTAIVGGMVWAAPLVQSLGSPAFAGTPAGTCSISNIQFLMNNESQTTYKFDEVGGDPVGGGDQSTPPCVGGLPGASKQEAFNQWCAANPGLESQVTITKIDATLWRIDPSPGYGVVWAVVKSGTSGPGGGDMCYYVQGSSTKSTLTKTESLYVSCYGDAFAKGTASCP
jgi:hypothetical protein